MKKRTIELLAIPGLLFSAMLMGCSDEWNLPATLSMGNYEKYLSVSYYKITDKALNVTTISYRLEIGGLCNTGKYVDCILTMTLDFANSNPFSADSKLDESGNSNGYEDSNPFSYKVTGVSGTVEKS
jgi:hypothetical protein